MHGGDAENTIHHFFKFVPNVITDNLCYAGGKNAVDRGKWVYERTKNWAQILAGSTDYSKYDAHQIEQHKMAEISLFSHFLPGVNDLTNLLSSQRANYGSGRVSEDYFTYELNYSRGSGEQNTSNGNSLLNLLMQLFCLNKQFNVLKALANGDMVLLYLGDDSLILTNFKWDPEIYKKDMEGVGMTVKVTFSNIYGTMFLNRWFCDATYMLGDKTYISDVLKPNIGRNLCGAYVSTKKYNSVLSKTWVKQNAIAYRNMFGHIKFLDNWHSNVEKSIDNSFSQYAHLLDDRHTKQHNFWIEEGRLLPLIDTLNHLVVHNINNNNQTYHNFTQDSLKRRYLLSDSQITELEKLFSKLPTVSTFDNHLIEKFIEVDILGIIHDTVDLEQFTHYAKPYDYKIADGLFYVDDATSYDIDVPVLETREMVSKMNSNDFVREIAVDHLHDQHICNIIDVHVNISGGRPLNLDEARLLDCVFLFLFHTELKRDYMSIRQAYDSMRLNGVCGHGACRCATAWAFGHINDQNRFYRTLHLRALNHVVNGIGVRRQ
jgi:uncharacterized short protein YbdD (DUF466 family)